MGIEIIRVARKIQIVEAVQFEKQTQMWEIAQWMMAYRIDGDPNGCEFTYTFQGEEKAANVRLGKWLVKDEAGFSAYSEIDFMKKFMFDRRSDGEE